MSKSSAGGDDREKTNNKDFSKSISSWQDSSPWATSSGGGSADIGPDEKVLLEIRQHPFARSPWTSAAIVVLILFLGLVSFMIIRNPLMPIFVYIFFLVSMTSFFMPSRYAFTEEKLVVDRITYRKGYPWARFRSYLMDKNGIYFSPSSDPDRFDRFRGVFLLMDKESRDKLAPVLEEIFSGRKGD